MGGHDLAYEHDTAGLWAARLVLGLLAILSLVCIAPAGFLYIWIVADYLQAGRPFSGINMIGWVFGLICAASIGAGVILAGVMLRLMAWSRAPLASLGLAVVSVLFIMLTYFVFSDTGNGSDSIDIVMLQAGCILGLLVAALPPFLHWSMARPKPALPAPQADRTLP
jgi:hypothetical protein